MQSRFGSLVESLAGVAVGFLVSLAVTAVVLPAYGLHSTFAQNAQITGIFTAVSIARSYILRRVFNRLR